MMRRSILTSLALLSLTGCAEHIKPVVVNQLPRAAFECPDNPNPPAPPYGQKGVAVYIVELGSVANECRAKLAAASPYKNQ